MSLHFRGIVVPALGSPRDITYRKYLAHEIRVEAKKHQMALLTAVGAPMITDEQQRRAWDKQAQVVFEEYVALMLGEELPASKREEANLLEFYETRIKHTQPKLSKDKKTGVLSVTNLPSI